MFLGQNCNTPRTVSVMSIFFFFQLGFTSCKAEQPLRGMELQEEEAQKD